VRITGAIVPVGDGACSAPTLQGPVFRWHCVDATERYVGDLSSTADAVFTVDGAFNSSSGATRLSGSEVFVGCLGDACGTLEWRYHVTIKTVAETLEPIRSHGLARITGGTGGLAGASGSFRFTCAEPCSYKGSIVL
jgi:hypothetical protein